MNSNIVAFPQPEVEQLFLKRALVLFLSTNCYTSWKKMQVAVCNSEKGKKANVMRRVGLEPTPLS